MGIPEKEPNKKPLINLNANDVFGFGKIVEKIPSQKLNGMNAACIISSIIILSFAGIMYLFKENTDSFPTNWDMRFMVITAVIIHFIGIINYIKRKR